MNSSANPGNHECNHLKPQIKMLSENDSLRIIYEQQSALQERLGRGALSRKSDMREKCSMLKDDMFNVNDEFSELMKLLPHKAWKNYSQEHLKSWLNDRQRTEAIFEYVDMLHFFINIAIILGFSPEEVFYYYEAKNKENFRRQDNKY